LLAVPLRRRQGAFLSVDGETGLLAFARCFFSEWRGSIPDDPGFGGAGVPWGKEGSLLQPLEQVLDEFRRRYKPYLDVASPRIEESKEAGAGKGCIRSVVVFLRAEPGKRIRIEV